MTPEVNQHEPASSGSPASGSPAPGSPASGSNTRLWTFFAATCVTAGVGLAALLPLNQAAAALAIGVLTGCACALDVHFERGGFLPIGYAGLIALAAAADVTTLLAAGLLTLGTLVLIRRRSVRSHVGAVARSVTLATVAGGLAAAALRTIGPPGQGDGELMWVLAIGAVVLATDAAVRLLPARRQDHFTPLEATPAELAVLSSAALITLGARHGGPVVAAFGALPLLIAHHASRQQIQATTVRAQTVRALSVVPEVAGLADAGHGERSSRYATALARELGLSRHDRDEVALAALVHHVGAVAFDADSPEASDTDVVTREAARLLAGRGTLASLSTLIEPGAATQSLAAATVRVAVDFDHLVGDQPTRTQWALAMLATSAPQLGGQRSPANLAHITTATQALERLVTRDPQFTREVIARSLPAPVAVASAGADTTAATESAKTA